MYIPCWLTLTEKRTAARNHHMHAQHIVFGQRLRGQVTEPARMTFRAGKTILTVPYWGALEGHYIPESCIVQSYIEHHT